MIHTAATQGTPQQIELFAGLRVPEARPRKTCARKRRHHVRPCEYIQLQFDLRERVEVDPDEIPEKGDYPTRVLVSALDAPALTITGVSSIFNFASNPSLLRAKLSGDTSQVRAYRKVIRADGVLRHMNVRPEDCAEWVEQEQARRARQRPPKPTERFKTRSAKLQGLIGA